MHNAHYSNLGEDAYPDMPKLPAIKGNITHSVLKRVAREAKELLGTQMTWVPAVVEALKKMGGYSETIRKCAGQELDRVEQNPRGSIVVAYITKGIEESISQIRIDVQHSISRLPHSAYAPHNDAGVSGSRERRALGYGTFMEVDLLSKELGMRGFIDLLWRDQDRCQILDYKTGAPNSNHRDQLELYAVLWWHDVERNPSHSMATGLTLLYPNLREDLQPPSKKRLIEITECWRERKADAFQAVTESLPLALPSTEKCSTCPVRQLCDEYWLSVLNRSPACAQGETEFTDAEVLVKRRHGPTSWEIEIIRCPRSSIAGKVILRDNAEHSVFSCLFQPGRVLRLLGVRVGEPVEEGDIQVLYLSSFSEAFVIS